MMKPRVQILMYHSISDRDDGDFDRHWVLPPEVFRRHLDVLQALRMPVLPLDVLLESRAPRRGVVLTFDDAYADFASTAWPLLDARSFPAALMVPTGHVGGYDAWNTGKAPRLRPLADWATVRRLQSEGVAVESHGCLHSDLRAANAADLARELVDSRARVTAELGRAPRFFAYPYNRTTPQIADAVRRAGYSDALAGPWSSGRPFDRHRYDVSGVHPAWLAAELLGVFDAARRVKRSMRRSATDARLRSRSHPSVRH